MHSLVRHYITRSPVECFKTYLSRQSVMNADFSVHVIFLNVASCFCIQLSLSTIKKLFLQLNVPFRFYQLSLKKVNNNKHKTTVTVEKTSVCRFKSQPYLAASPLFGGQIAEAQGAAGASYLLIWLTLKSTDTEED